MPVANGVRIGAKNAHGSARGAEKTHFVRDKDLAMKVTTSRMARHDGADLELNRILVPVDFSPAAQKAMHYAFALARRFGSEVLLLHVLEPDGALGGLPFSSDRAPSEQAWLAAEKNLRALSAQPRANGSFKVSTSLRSGHPEFEITDAAKEFDADAIVIATHGYSSWKHFCLGSVTEKVVRAAPCPVFTMREKEHALT